MIDAEEEGSPFKVPMRLEEDKLAVKIVGNFGSNPLVKCDDDGAPKVDQDGNLSQHEDILKPEMAPNCNL